MNCLQHARSSGQGAIVCKSRANTSWAYHVQHVCYVARWDSSSVWFDRVEIAFTLAEYRWLKPLTDEKGEKPEYPEKKPGDELQKMPYTKARKFNRDSNPHTNIGDRRLQRKQTCQPLHHASLLCFLQNTPYGSIFMIL